MEASEGSTVAEKLQNIYSNVVSQGGTAGDGDGGGESESSFTRENLDAAVSEGAFGDAVTLPQDPPQIQTA